MVPAASAEVTSQSEAWGFINSSHVQEEDNETTLRGNLNLPEQDSNAGYNKENRSLTHGSIFRGMSNRDLFHTWACRSQRRGRVSLAYGTYSLSLDGTFTITHVLTWERSFDREALPGHRTESQPTDCGEGDTYL
jgi:hypothetical protein